MKKIILTLILVLFSSISYAQHMKFDGLSINGSITEFTTKLKAKGYTIDPQSKNEPTGVRLFRGKYEGQRVVAGVYYHPTAKTVMAVMVMYQCSSQDAQIKKVSQFLSEMIEKYGEDNIEHETGGYDEPDDIWSVELDDGTYSVIYDSDYDEVYGYTAVKCFKDRINTERYQ